jgi:hypothetical protein
MICTYCGNQLKANQNECPLCGTALEVAHVDLPVFGRGHSMVFFQWLYKYLPIFYALNIVFSLATLYHIFFNLYRGNVDLFLSIFANTIYVNMRLANIILMMVIIGLRWRNDQVNFARMFVYKHILQIVELVALFLAGGAQIGLVEGLTETFIRELFFNLVVFIPIYRYFNKRITIFGFGEQ